MTPYWLTAFLDFAPDHFDAGVDFWRAATGYDVSARRGDDGEFATLVPRDGDDFLRVQRLGDGPDRIHLDLHVTDLRAAADRAVDLGATEIADVGDVILLRSPGGFTFCFVTHPAATRPAPTTWPGGHTSLLDQVCLDIPSAVVDEECEFWATLTGWERRQSAVSEDFSPLVRPSGQPLRILMQRLGDQHGDVRAHLDWAADDRDAEVARHTTLGARVVARHHVWTVLADPTGREYCITDRDPATGLLG